MSAIRFDHVSKDFGHFPSPLHRLREALGGRPRHAPVPVLRDVTFEIPRGQSVAVIGPNGVGKSTMLHLIAGLLQPTSGSLAVEGNVRGLLELGGSFLPDLTGRENARFFHEVIFKGEGRWSDHERDVQNFADIGEFFDRPVRTYSSGMFLRLAFASATAVVPDILLIDEVLAVGDARFQYKCFQRMREMRDRGTTILLVTHNVFALPALCDRTIVLDHGEVAFDGDPVAGVERYYRLFFTAKGDADDARRYGSGGAAIVRGFASRDGATEEQTFTAGERVRIVMEVAFDRDVAEPHFGFSCTTREGLQVYVTSTAMLGSLPSPASAGDKRRVEIAFDLDVAMHDLFVDLSVFEVVSGAVIVLDARHAALHLTVVSSSRFVGITDLDATISVETA